MTQVYQWVGQTTLVTLTLVLLVKAADRVEQWWNRRHQPLYVVRLEDDNARWCGWRNKRAASFETAK